MTVARSTTPGSDAVEVPATIAALVRRAAVIDPERPALIFEDGLTLSRGDLIERSERFAGYLREVTQPGEAVAAMTTNRAEFMVAWLAAIACGCVFVALNPEAGEHDLAHVLCDCAAVLVVVDEHGAPRLDAVASRCPALRERIELGPNEPDGLADRLGAAPLRFDGIEADPTTVTNVYYTSGTTGPPKGCMVSNAYWQRLVSSYLSERGLGADERMLCCLKFFYNDPSWQLLASLHAGAALVVMRRFSVSRYWDVVRGNGVTQLFTIGSIPALLLSRDPSPRDRDHRVRFGVQVAIDAARHREMTERWGIPWVDSYGLTETGGLVAVPLGDAEKMTGSGTMGRPRRGVEVRLVDDQGVDVADGEPGELVARVAAMIPAISTGRTRRQKSWTPTAGSTRATTCDATRMVGSTSSGARRTSFAARARTLPRARSRRYYERTQL